MLINTILLILGFSLLIIGGNIFVKASVNIAQRLRIPSVVIGLTVVALGTSAPEAVISVTAAVKGSNSMAIGNAIGSNMFNLLLIVGVCAIIKPVVVKFKEISRDFWGSAGAAALLLLVALISGGISEGGGQISRFFAVFFLVIFAGYMVLLVRQTLKERDFREVADTVVVSEMGADFSVSAAADLDTSVTAEVIAAKDEPVPMPLPRSILLAVVGCALIVAGGQFTVNSASDIALGIGISPRMIGLTVIALGTSLPELVVSLVACKKGEGEVALGNVIGSSIFNILFVLGITGLVSPLPVDMNVIYDLIILTAGSFISLLFAFTSQRIIRAEGLLLVMIYGSYMAYLIMSR